MGLDFLELILRTEETFAVDLADEECERIRTIGDLYVLVLQKLELLYIPSTEIEAKSMRRIASFSRSLKLCDWTTPDVWLTLKSVIHDQLGVKLSRITEAATFLDDLRCD